MTGFTSSQISSDNPSVISRFVNLLNAAVNTTIGKRLHPLPKIIVVVPDDDIINSLKDKDHGYPTAGLPKAFSRLVKFVMNGYERNLASFKEKLQNKNKKEGYPQFLWILAPLHEKFDYNSEREKFNRCVEDMSKFRANVISLELKKVWDAKDGSLVERNKLTTDGMRSYWEAVDKTVCYCDSATLKKKYQKKTTKQLPNHDQNDHNKYRLQNPKIEKDVSRFKQYRKLPTPQGQRY